MTDTKTLIEDTREWIQIHGDNHYQQEAARRMGLLVDALEAAERALHGKGGWDEWIAEHVRIEQERGALAAVVEKAEDFVTRHYLDTRFGDEVLPILANAPSDALREHDAQVRAEAIRSARDGIMPPYNFELRYDGTEDPGAAEYVEIMHEVHDRLSEVADQIEKEAGL